MRRSRLVAEPIEPFPRSVSQAASHAATTPGRFRLDSLTNLGGPCCAHCLVSRGSEPAASPAVFSCLPRAVSRLACWHRALCPHHCGQIRLGVSGAGDGVSEAHVFLRAAGPAQNRPRSESEPSGAVGDRGWW